MDLKDRELLEKVSKIDPEVKSLWDDHVIYEKKLQVLEAKPFLSPQEELDLKSLKKQKLDGKTRLVALLNKHKQTGV
ncbi:DUF465 domain-containing protein [Desulfovibrio litoralis]|uniref:DUF465 domain-containing protein n=1 Tax=Desulfovibrio litoralis DSM 11393 TaxID=1121455 RepID=A0A1M7TI41_9BACT|nr:DUF465 domain-containing protein [Desulfovibrio litoralis]SHN70412.1 hypothetical protein SAMN02745728_02040 [Desulfovibrio litoralis DSM 11393]